MEKLLIIACISLLMLFAGRPQEKIQDDQSGFAVVELFTSEGCSSCPAADRVIEKLSEKRMKNVFILAYHVDYWNRLGWTDQFSNSDFSTRQSRYATAFQSHSVYTPQVVVNGQQQFVGSDETRLTREVENSLTRSNSILMFKAERTEKKVILNIMSAGLNSGCQLQIALVQPEASTKVRAGENAGRELHHLNIVRSLSTFNTSEDVYRIDIPASLQGIGFQVIVFKQDRSTMKILSANQQMLPL